MNNVGYEGVCLREKQVEKQMDHGMDNMMLYASFFAWTSC